MGQINQPVRIARKRRPIAKWRERMLDAFDGLSRNPLLLKIPEHRSLLSIYVETVIDAAMHLSPMARERLDFRDDSGGSLKVWHCHEG
jgi:hypothetical protein